MSVKSVAIAIDEVLSIKWSINKGRNLRSLRKRQRNMGQSEVCEKLLLCGVSLSRQYLHRIETDPRVLGVTVEVIRGLCKVFGVEIEEILCLNSRSITIVSVDTDN